METLDRFVDVKHSYKAKLIAIAAAIVLVVSCLGIPGLAAFANDGAKGTLICGLEGTEGHVHGDSCKESVLICDLEEHKHAATECGGAPACSETEHTHAGTCYVKKVTCDLPEGSGAHKHGPDCYAADSTQSVCAKEEHVHRFTECGGASVCPKEEHTHGVNCSIIPAPNSKNVEGSLKIYCDLTKNNPDTVKMIDLAADNGAKLANANFVWQAGSDKAVLTLTSSLNTFALYYEQAGGDWHSSHKAAKNGTEDRVNLRANLVWNADQQKWQATNDSELYVVLDSAIELSSNIGVLTYNGQPQGIPADNAFLTSYKPGRAPSLNYEYKKADGTPIEGLPTEVGKYIAIVSSVEKQAKEIEFEIVPASDSENGPGSGNTDVTVTPTVPADPSDPVNPDANNPGNDEPGNVPGGEQGNVPSGEQGGTTNDGNQTSSGNQGSGAQASTPAGDNGAPASAGVSSQTGTNAPAVTSAAGLDAATAADDEATAAIEDEANPLAAPDESTIEDDENPLAAFDSPQCWVHWLIISGMVLTAVYGVAVIARRKSSKNDIDKFQKELLKADEQGTATARNNSTIGAAAAK